MQDILFVIIFSFFLFTFYFGLGFTAVTHANIIRNNCLRYQHNGIIQLLFCMSIKNAYKTVRRRRKNEPAHDLTYKIACAPSEDSDQPGHSPSLISDFVVRSVCS